MQEELVQKLVAYFTTREDVSLAYLFGSMAGAETHAHSDVDVAIYFATANGELQYEDRDALWYNEEHEVRSTIEGITKKEVDLIVLNRAPAGIVFSAVRGVLLKNTDQKTANDLLARSMFDAIDFRHLAHEYYETFMRSASLNAIDRDRLQKVLSLFETESRDLLDLKKMNQLDYKNIRSKKRDLERAVENTANMVFDIARIILGSSKVQIPDTYRDLILNLRLVNGFDHVHAESLSKAAGMRNLLAHQYDDIRFVGIVSFIEHTEKAFEYLLEFTKEYLKNN